MTGLMESTRPATLGGALLTIALILVALGAYRSTHRELRALRGGLDLPSGPSGDPNGHPPRGKWRAWCGGRQRTGNRATEDRAGQDGEDSGPSAGTNDHGEMIARATDDGNPTSRTRGRS
jgi:hypothetical protein